MPSVFIYAVCVLLLPVSTSSLLFHNVIKKNACEIRFLKGRVKFNGINIDGDLIEVNRPGHNSGMHDSMLVIFDTSRGKSEGC